MTKTTEGKPLTKHQRFKVAARALDDADIGVSKYVDYRKRRPDCFTLRGHVQLYVGNRDELTLEQLEQLAETVQKQPWLHHDYARLLDIDTFLNAPHECEITEDDSWRLKMDAILSESPEARLERRKAAHAEAEKYWAEERAREEAEKKSAEERAAKQVEQLKTTLLGSQPDATA